MYLCNVLKLLIESTKQTLLPMLEGLKKEIAKYVVHKINMYIFSLKIIK